MPRLPPPVRFLSRLPGRHLGLVWLAMLSAIGMVLWGGCGLRGARAEEGKAPLSWTEIPTGTFRMGAPDVESCRRDEPRARRIRMTHRFEVATFEVTQADFSALMGYEPSFASKCKACPVDSVSWHEAAAYAVALSAAHGLAACYACEGGEGDTVCEHAAPCDGYRLPTPAEWEYAARAGTRSGTYGGGITACMSLDEVGDEIGWFKSNSGGQPHAVGEKEPNPWGLYDVAGNVAEWTDDQGPEALQQLRGGSWYHNAHHLRAAARLIVPKDSRLSYAGFRLVRTLGRAPPQ